MKTCTKCKQDLPLDAFGKDSSKPLGLRLRCKKCVREYYETVREERLQKAKVYYREHTARRLLCNAKMRAKKQGLPFNITEEDIVIPERCPVFPDLILQVNGKLLDNSPSVDKIIPALGYVKGNIRVISWKANRLKSNGTLADFEAICNYLRSPDGTTTHT